MKVASAGNAEVSDGSGATSITGSIRLMINARRQVYAALRVRDTEVRDLTGQVVRPLRLLLQSRDVIPKVTPCPALFFPQHLHGIQARGPDGRKERRHHRHGNHVDLDHNVSRTLVPALSDVRGPESAHSTLSTSVPHTLVQWGDDGRGVCLPQPAFDRPASSACHRIIWRRRPSLATKRAVVPASGITQFSMSRSPALAPVRGPHHVNRVCQETERAGKLVEYVMALSPGTRLGPYEIVAPIGAGGMGEVYKARDTRLQRDVAIKVLSEEFALNPERRARFEREARAVAALSHPNIVSLYDIGEDGGRLIMVSELVPGAKLCARTCGMARCPCARRPGSRCKLRTASRRHMRPASPIAT